MLAPLEVVRCEPLAGTTPTDEAVDRIQHEWEKPFDLSAGLLLRGLLLTNGADRHVVTVSTDHLVADGVSIALIVADLIAHYTGADAASPPAEKESGTLVEFAARQRDLR